MTICSVWCSFALACFSTHSVSIEDLAIDLPRLDAAQRTVAAAWVDNPHCNIAGAASNRDLGMCMSEKVSEFIARTEEKEELVEKVVAVPWGEMRGVADKIRTDDERRLYGTPEPYAFALQQKSLSGLHNLEHDESQDSKCSLLQDVKIPSIEWPDEAATPIDLSHQAGAARKNLREKGTVLLRNVSGQPNFLTRAKHFLLERASKPHKRFTEYVHLAQHRHHMRLPLGDHPIIEELFRILVEIAAIVLVPLVSALGVVVEFASFITNPGAAGQRFHSDTGNSFSNTQAPLYSVYLFLTDVDDRSEGPLQVAPRTHGPSGVRESTRAAVREFAKLDDLEAKCMDHWRLCPIKAGDIAVYDSTGLHRGTSNNSTRSRIVVYLSVLGIGNLSFGQTYAADTKLLETPHRLGDMIAGPTFSTRSRAAILDAMRDKDGIADELADTRSHGEL